MANNYIIASKIRKIDTKAMAITSNINLAITDNAEANMNLKSVIVTTNKLANYKYQYITGNTRCINVNIKMVNSNVNANISKKNMAKGINSKPIQLLINLYYPIKNNI